MRPKQQHRNDAGCDLEAAKTVELSPGSTALVPTGYYPEEGDIPDGCVGLVFARSSLHKSDLTLANGVGVIDSGYRGEVLIALHNMSSAWSTRVNEGERIAQIVVVPLALDSKLYGQHVIDTERVEGGFGSTGKGN